MMTPTQDIDPMVPELPRQMLADGGERREPTRSEKTFENAEADAPLVPDLS